MSNPGHALWEAFEGGLALGGVRTVTMRPTDAGSLSDAFSVVGMVMLSAALQESERKARLDCDHRAADADARLRARTLVLVTAGQHHRHPLLPDPHQRLLRDVLGV